MSGGSIAAIIISILILIGLVLSLLAQSGAFLRIRKGAKSDNFEVNPAMMKYFAVTYVDNWYQQYSLYIQYGLINFDSTLPLSEQYVDNAKTQTYYDYFKAGVTNQVTTMLKYCEAAKADSTIDFKEYEKNAEKFADETLAVFEEAAKKENVSINTYLASQYGEHVSKSDVRKSLVLLEIASQYSAVVEERLGATVTMNDKENYFSENLSSFVTAEYLTFTLTSTGTPDKVDPDDYVGGKDSDAYKAILAEIKAADYTVSGSTTAAYKADIAAIEATLKPEDYEGGKEGEAYKKALEELKAKIKPADYVGGKDSAAYKADLAELEATLNPEDYEGGKEGEAYKGALAALEATLNPADYTVNGKDSVAYKADVKELEATLKPEDYEGGKEGEAYKEALAALVATLNPDDYLGGSESAAYKKAIEELEATLNPEDYEGGKESKAYNDKVNHNNEETKKHNDAQKLKDQEFIESLKKAANAEEFKRLLLDHEFDEAFTSAYNAAVKGFTSAEKPSTKELDEFKALVKAKIIDAVINGDDDIELEEEKEEEKEDDNGAAEQSAEPENTENKEEDKKPEKSKWDTAKETLPASVITKLNSKITSAEKTDSYGLEKDNELQAFLFGGIKAQFGIKYAEGETEGTSAKVGESKVIDEVKDEKSGQYTLSIYYVTEPAGRDETILRDVGHILIKFDSNEKDADKKNADAKKKAEEIYNQLLEGATDNLGFKVVTKEAFEKIANEKNEDSNIFYTDVKKGDMVESFENWLFDAKLVGEIGLVESTYGWHVMYYDGENVSKTEGWEVSAEEGALSTKINDWFEALPYEVEVNDKIFESIFS